MLCVCVFVCRVSCCVFVVAVSFLFASDVCVVVHGFVVDSKIVLIHMYMNWCCYFCECLSLLCSSLFVLCMPLLLIRRLNLYLPFEFFMRLTCLCCSLVLCVRPSSYQVCFWVFDVLFVCHLLDCFWCVLSVFHVFAVASNLVIIHMNWLCPVYAVGYLCCVIPFRCVCFLVMIVSSFVCLMVFYVCLFSNLTGFVFICLVWLLVFVLLLLFSVGLSSLVCLFFYVVVLVWCPPVFCLYFLLSFICIMFIRALLFFLYFVVVCVACVPCFVCCAFLFLCFMLLRSF